MKKLKLNLRTPIYMCSCRDSVYHEKTGEISAETEAEILSLERNYESICADLNQIQARENPVYLRLLQNFGANTTNLSLTNTDSINFSDIFASMLNLEEMTLSHCEIPKKIKMYNLMTVELRKLKKIKMIKCDEGLLKCFRGPNIISACFEHMFLNSEISKRFFCDLPRLEKLKISNFYGAAFFDGEIQDLPFHLKKLTINMETKDDETYNKTLVKFLKLQSFSISSIVCSWASKEIFKSILNDVRSLKKLKISFETIPKECEFYENLKTNNVLEEIEVYGMYEHAQENYKEYFDLIVKKCLNLKQLQTTGGELHYYVIYGKDYDEPFLDDYFVKKIVK
jgi:hypothetical protein